ncbi:unnamed protein product [Paramecium octaurelia]|uniref:Reverse transcriptase domain-containing protein n=1 Tax=Paramecium octaurelia TaxID=43137 RepID=A0A8S1YPG2_PAROT|nr:unnamed protein product [Paramecium octaurelia]
MADLFSRDKVTFFQTLKKITILNPFKKDGSIFSYFIDDSNQLQFGDIAIRNCLTQLSIISNGQKFRPLKLPSLPPLNTLDITELQRRMSRNKAISFDGVSDNFIRNCKNVHIFCDIWKQSTIETNYACCRARLVPLNKVFPDIPTKTQFRPITILSPLFKLLELRFLPRLQQYLSTRLSKGQAGFIPGSSTQINIIRLLNTLTGYKKQDKMDCIFIDFSNAFNSINRQRLFNILSAKSILDGIEIKFLNHLYTNLHYICPQMNTTFYFQNGVPQGSPLSPALFNIYLEDFLASLKQNCNFNYTSYEFADDIVIIIAHRNIQSFLQKLVLISEEYELRLNQKKCGIFFIQNHKRCQYNNIQGFPIVKSYKYLGINILNNGKISLQLDKVEQTLKFLSGKLLWVSQKLNWKQKYQLFQTFLLPHILYICPSIPTQKYKNIFQRLQKLYKSSFKKVCGFPKCLPNEFLDLILPPLELLIAKHTNKVISRMNNGNFGQTTFINNYFNEIEEMNQNSIYKLLPNNFNQLFYLYPKICRTHQCNLSYRHIINFHSNFHISEFLINLRGIFNNNQQIQQPKNQCNRLEKIIAKLLTE